MEPKLEPLNAADMEWLGKLQDALRVSGLADDLDAMDEQFEAYRATWYATAEDAREDPNPLVSLIGAGLGQYIADRTGLEWMRLTDEYGTDLAIVGPPGRIVITPFNAVGKHWVQHDEPVARFAESVLQHIAKVSQAD